jgi:Do/DeqQ family serine protease
MVVGSGAARDRLSTPLASSTQANAVADVTGSAPAASWSSLVKGAMPAVVNISSTKTVRGPTGPRAPFFADPFFGLFPSEPQAAPRRERSLGSGVIVSADGYALTNSHVVNGAHDIRITLADRRELKAELVGADPKSDLAVLKLPGSSFSAVRRGDSGQLEVAEVVLAIGSPFGLTQTVTMGIVSAVGRANLGITDYEDFIQTDAAINPGNSGGALVNSRGELVGINTAIFSQSGGYQGIGFAVPVNMASQVMEQIVKGGRVTRGYLGVVVQELTPAITKALELPRSGVLVGDVEPGGPAARAGVLRGDLITAVDGQPVTDVGSFRNLVARTAPGSKLRLTIVRGGRELAAEATVGELKDQEPEAPAVAGNAPGPLGIAVTDVTPQVAAKLGLPADEKGAVVAELAPSGPAAEAGLRPGDVIQEVNRQPVRSAREFAQAVEKAGDRDVVLLVNRGGITAYFVVERSR